jgi:hypothetical protein
MSMMHVLRSLIVPLLALATAGCVTNLPRYDKPARIEAVALGAGGETSDLIVIDVVWSYKPKDTTDLLLVIPRDRDAAAPLELRQSDPSPREKLFWQRKVERWSAEGRARADLRLPSEVPPDQRRDYSLRNVRDPSGGFDLEVTRTREGVREKLGSVRLPAEYTPARVAKGWRCAAAVPMAAIDLAWIPITAASFVALIPFGSIEAVVAAAHDDSR